MILILESLSDDKRRRVALFPTKNTVDNFYDEIMKFDNSLRQYVYKEYPHLKKKPSEFTVDDRKELQRNITYKN
eukprot:Pgem_evm1s16039